MFSDGAYDFSGRRNVYPGVGRHLAKIGRFIPGFFERCDRVRDFRENKRRIFSILRRRLSRQVNMAQDFRPELVAKFVDVGIVVLEIFDVQRLDSGVLRCQLAANSFYFICLKYTSFLFAFNTVQRCFLLETNKVLNYEGFGPQRTMNDETK